jgi:hypothetical protein
MGHMSLKDREAPLSMTIDKPNPQDISVKPYQLSPGEFRAHIDAAIDAARVPWERGTPRLDVADDDDDELVVEPVPVSAPSRRQRKRSLAKVCEAARKAGANHVIVDGVVIAFSPSAAVPAESNGNEFDKWMARHASPIKGH